LTQKQTERLAQDNIEVREEKIERLEGKDGVLEYIVFANGERLARRAMFFSTGQHKRSDLATQLGCVFTDDGCVATGDYETTSVPGLYAAGDASKLVQFVIVAASEGAQAAVAINKELIKEDLT
jgi:thioredoxin reductase